MSSDKGITEQSCAQAGRELTRGAPVVIQNSLLSMQPCCTLQTQCCSAISTYVHCCRLAEELLAQQAVRLGLVDPAAADIPQEENSTASVPSEAATVSRPHAVDRHQASSGSEQGKIDLKQQHLQPHHHQHEQLQVSSSARQIFSAIFAVGDNPAADVRGASQAGPPWVSVLVRTGVFNKGLNSTSDPAHLVVTDVCAAVQAGLHRARTSRWHSMR